MSTAYYEYQHNEHSNFYSSFVNTLPLNVQNYLDETKNYYSRYLLHMKILLNVYVKGIKQLDYTYIEIPYNIKYQIYERITEYNKIMNNYENNIQNLIGYENTITFLLEIIPAKIKFKNNEEMFTYFNKKYLLSKKKIDKKLLTNLSIMLLSTGKIEEYIILEQNIIILPFVFRQTF